MKKKVIMQNLNIKVKSEQILKRLGYNKHKSIIDKLTEKKINKIISEINLLSDIKGAYKLTEIMINTVDTSIVFSENNHKISNTHLFNNLTKKNGNSIILLAATVGKDIVNKIQFYSQNNEIENAVLLDAAASELAENTINFIEKNAVNYYIKLGNKSNYRFSPGYKEVELKNQVIFEDLLKISSIDIHINNNFILEPEKSITAFLPFKKYT